MRTETTSLSCLSRLRGCIALLIAVGVLCVCCTTASAVTPGPGWEVDNARTYPTNLPPGGTGYVELDLYNVGATASTGTVTMTDVLPPGLTATAGYGVDSDGEKEEEDEQPWQCVGDSVVSCTNNPEILPAVQPGAMQRIVIAVDVAPDALGSETNQVTVAGGGARTPASTSNAILVSSTPPGFGFDSFDGWLTNADGTPDTQAGSHPYELTLSFDINHFPSTTGAPNGGNVRNAEVAVPPGILGDPNATPQCTRQQLDEEACPASSQVGVDRAGLNGEGEPNAILTFPVYNMVPPPGVPAEFSFDLFGRHTFLDAGIRSGGDYGITEHVDDINTSDRVTSDSITLWGVPADPSHDAQREGITVIGGRRCRAESGGCASGAEEKPLLTLPSSCAGPQEFTVRANTWQNAALTSEIGFVSHDANGVPLGFGGCEHLTFDPSIVVAPDTSKADTPAGLTVELKDPQEGLLTPEGIAASDIEGTTVTLPEGVVINPGQAAGLEACQSSQDGVGSEGSPSCPAASKVGTVAIETPLLKDRLEGDMYVLQSNPPNLRLLLAASADGVNLKLVGDVGLDPLTGRVTVTFEQAPELPFTDLKLTFSGGAQAALATPTGCGTYSTTSELTPWGNPFVPDAFPRSEFAITSGPGGGACASPLPFSPSLIAGSTTDQAAGYTDFSLLLQRADGQQRISTLQFKAPKGLLGMISKVPLCGEPRAAEGTCPSASQIGHTVVEAGPGPYPLVVPQPGQPPAPIYLTGAYDGAPYGLSIVVPLVVGPFTLRTQVIRARIEVDPRTAQLTVTTGQLPTIVDGIPTDLRTIDAVIDRPGFMFNPTDCSPQSFSGVATSTQGASAPISSPFQVGSCRSLTFKPDFKVSTSGRTSRANGASLNAKIVYPNVAPGNNQASSQSNIASVKVDLPKQLPSRLTTLQKACPAATFQANPASCPAASVVGHASAITPVLPVKLTGPTYFVSHAGEEFPSLIVVLQGYGVRIDLVGTTFISKKNITSSTFKQIPDVPITSFELTLPEGRHSALAANGNLCKSKLAIPTAFTAQDGAVIHQSTPISVTGCPKAKKKTEKK
jgi:hypothetical protein